MSEVLYSDEAQEDARERPIHFLLTEYAKDLRERSDV